MLLMLQHDIFFVIPFLMFVLPSTGWWEKQPRDSRLLTSIHGWQLGGITGRTHDLNTHYNFSKKFGIDFRTYPTSIGLIMSCMGPCSCRGVHSSNTRINSEHTCNPIWCNHGSSLPFPPSYWSWSPPFHGWLPSWDEGYFKSKNIYFCFGSFTIFFF